MTSNKTKVFLAIRLCRWLPLSLAFRVKRYLFYSIGRGTAEQCFREKSLFGSSYIQGTMDIQLDAYFALYGSANVEGLIVAQNCIGRGDTVYEFGANVGTETVSLADLVGPSGKVVAVEPDPSNVRVLNERIRYNSLEQVAVVPEAVSDSQGELLLYAGTRRNPGLSFVRELGHHDPVHTLGVVTVRCRTGDELMSEHGPPRMILMDIEGAELSALQGCTKILSEARPILFLEVDAQLLRGLKASPTAILSLLREFDYDVVMPHKWAMPHVTPADLCSECHTDWLAIPNETGPVMRKTIARAMLKVRLFPRFSRP